MISIVPGGYMGKILRIDLSVRKSYVEELDEKIAENFIGGMGLGMYFLYKDLKPKIDPLSPENELIFVTGPLTGTLAPCSGTTCLVTKSPLTGTCLDSYMGGYFGPEMKFAGYDAIIIQGVSEKPVYVVIDDGSVEIRKAEHVWGKLTSETEEIIREEVGKDFKIACIGPAGEKLVRFSSIVSERRTLGRGGSGAVMGSKKLKAIAVRGGKGIEIHDHEKFMDTVYRAFDILRRALKEDFLLSNWTLLGTNGTLIVVNYASALPTRNYTSGYFEYANEITGETLSKRGYYRRHLACYNCPIHCSKVSVVPYGKYAGTTIDGPEYESVGLLGSNCGVKDPAAIIRANYLCDELGMDTISTGNVVGFAMECFERGILTLEDTGGIELRFGNGDAIVEIIEKIAKREGLGDILAEGVKRASEKIGKGSEAFAIQVKGMEFPSWEPRGLRGSGLAYATSHRGACHKRGIMGDELVSKSGLVTEGKAMLVKKRQDEVAVYFSLVVCRFATFVVPMSLWAEMLTAVTGFSYDENKLMMIGDRIETLTRVFNVREGFTRKDDYLPRRFYEEPAVSGPTKGVVFPREEYEKMLNEFYELRGWDKEGIPTKEKLKELGLMEFFAL